MFEIILYLTPPGIASCLLQLIQYILTIYCRTLFSNTLASKRLKLNFQSKRNRILVACRIHNSPIECRRRSACDSPSLPLLLSYGTSTFATIWHVHTCIMFSSAALVTAPASWITISSPSPSLCVSLSPSLLIESRLSIAKYLLLLTKGNPLCANPQVLDIIMASQINGPSMLATGASLPALSIIAVCSRFHVRITHNQGRRVDD